MKNDSINNIPNLSKRFPCTFDVWEIACIMYSAMGDVEFTGRLAAGHVGKSAEQTGSVFGAMRRNGIIRRIGRHHARENRYANKYRFCEEFMEYVDKKLVVVCKANG